jgi:hypothetical protein
LKHVIEQWIEHGHQWSSTYDDNLKTLPYKMQAIISAQGESWVAEPKVQREMQFIDKNSAQNINWSILMRLLLRDERKKRVAWKRSKLKRTFLHIAGC